MGMAGANLQISSSDSRIHLTACSFRPDSLFYTGTRIRTLMAGGGPSYVRYSIRVIPICRNRYSPSKEKPIGRRLQRPDGGLYDSKFTLVENRKVI